MIVDPASHAYFAAFRGLYLSFRARAQSCDGARARNRLRKGFGYEHEHHFIEHEHDPMREDLGKDEGASRFMVSLVNAVVSATPVGTQRQAGCWPDFLVCFSISWAVPNTVDSGNL